MNETKERTRLVPYGPLTLGLIQPEWLFTYHYFPEEPDEGERQSPPGESGKEKTKIRINFRARQDPEAP